jgi:hypothetical protein
VYLQPSQKKRKVEGKTRTVNVGWMWSVVVGHGIEVDANHERYRQRGNGDDGDDHEWLGILADLSQRLFHELVVVCFKLLGHLVVMHMIGNG